MTVTDIIYVEVNKIGGKVNGVYCEIEVKPWLIEDIKAGYYGQGPPLPEEDAIRLLSDKLIKYYEDNIKSIRQEKLKKLNEMD